jgi:hypothetical protein
LSYRRRLFELIATLQKTNIELQAAINSAFTNNEEKTYNLANKVAKVSYQLRKHLSKGEHIGKFTTDDDLLTLSPEQQLVQLKELSGKLNLLISQLTEDQTSGLVDIRRLEETYQQVKEIETQALSLKALTK